jgi:long-chain acyl-CoA synthetase
MLISLDEEAIASWAKGGRLDGRPYDELVASAEVEELIDGYVKELNAKLNRWETVKKFAILPRDLSIEAGEITPSMKIKRRSVETNFAAQIDKMYEGSLAQI